MSDLNNVTANPVADLSTASNKHSQETGISASENAHPLQHENGELSQLSTLTLSDSLEERSLSRPSEQTDDSTYSDQGSENQGAEHGNIPFPVSENRQSLQVVSSENCHRSSSHSTIGRADSQPTSTSLQSNPLGDYDKVTYAQTVSNGPAQAPATSPSSSSPYNDYETDNIPSTSNTQTTRISQYTSKSRNPPVQRNKHSANGAPKQATQFSTTNLPSRGSHGRSTQSDPAGARLFKNALLQSGLSKNRSENSRRPGPSEARLNFQKADPFTQWMRSRSPEHSLWCSETHRKSLLSYIGKICSEQRDQMYFRFDQIQANKPELDDLDMLHEILERTKQQRDAQKSLDKWEDRSRIDRRVKDLKFIFEFNRNNRVWSSPFTVKPHGLEQLIDRERIRSYFDFGCGDGTITAGVGAYLGLSKENIFGGDVFSGQSENITFVALKEDQLSISLPDDQVDLITSFVTFHHVSQIEDALGELARILRLGGYLILREHDCKTEQSLSAKYLHFVHAIMMIARVGEFAGSAKDYNDESDYLPSESDENNPIDWPVQKSRIIEYMKTIHYRTGGEWQEQLRNVGFRLHATLSYGTDEAKNPQRLFYAVYQLTNK